MDATLSSAIIFLVARPAAGPRSVGRAAQTDSQIILSSLPLSGHPVWTSGYLSSSLSLVCTAVIGHWQSNVVTRIANLPENYAR